MESMINLDGATLLFPTSFGYFNPHMIKMAKKFPKLRFEHCGGLWTEQATRRTPAATSAISTRPSIISGIVAGYMSARAASSASSPPSRSRRCCATSTPSRWAQARQSEGHHAGDLHRRLVDAGQGSRSHQQPDRPGRRRPHLPRRRPEGRGRERRAARRISAAITSTRRRSRRRPTSPAPSGTGKRCIRHSSR